MPYRCALLRPPDGQRERACRTCRIGDQFDPTQICHHVRKASAPQPKMKLNNHQPTRSRVPTVTFTMLMILICIASYPTPVAQAITHLVNQKSPIGTNNSLVQELVRNAPQLYQINDHSTVSANNQLQPVQAARQSTLPLEAAARNFVKLGTNTSSTLRALNYVGSHPSKRHPLARFNQTTDLSRAINEADDHTQRRGLIEKICIGTSNRMSGHMNKTNHYQMMVDRYRNCTYVIGNLEITWLEKNPDNTPIDLSFLESIREITGYLLIAYVEVDRIRMPNLQIIRGRDLFKLNNDPLEEYAMFLIENSIKSLELPNLREILTGSVGAFNNTNLCHIRTINWDEILNSYKVIIRLEGPEPECPPCDSSCQGSCWGQGPELCQKFSKTNCSPQCSQGRCFGSLPRECCHLFCAGGCTGPKQTDCLACKNFYDDGECIQECPSMMRYNTNSFSWEPNPLGKYAFGATCVKECPEHLLRDNGACVRACPPNKRNVNGECVPCTGPCPKNCQGIEIVHSGNIDNLINCTVIEGSISILQTSFDGHADMLPNNTLGPLSRPMHPSKLEVLKTVTEITGYLNIQASHPHFRDLSFFRNLHTIGGRHTTDLFHTLSIIGTSLVSLNLRSLRKVKGEGKIVMESNQNLCFASTINWTRANLTKLENIILHKNADSNDCKRRNLRCHKQCSNDGCWGPGSDECLSCKNYMLDDYCVENCYSNKSKGPMYEADNTTCARCHPECKEGCRGKGADQCTQCKNVKDGPYCVSECPRHKYNKSGTCEECDKSCAEGCTGPLNKVGEGGCNACGKVVINSTDPTLVAHCISAEEPCPGGFYQEFLAPQSDGPLKLSVNRPVCRKCHPRCKNCTGMGTHTSVCECANYINGEQCEEQCPRDTYTNKQQRRCFKCSPECNGCFGDTDADCISCRVYRIYYDSYPLANPAPLTLPSSGPSAIAESEPNKQQSKFKCAAHCPPEKPYRISEPNMLDPYCSEDPGVDPENPHVVSLGSTSFIFMVIFVVFSIVCCIVFYRCKIEKDKTVKQLTMTLSGLDDVEPLNPSNLKPNLAPLRSIKETELRKGKKMGSGSGGTVYQGIWTPEGQADKPKWVAIKELHDNPKQSNQNKQFLEEAYIMASVNHPNLVRLMAICMTPNSRMLVTQLMPLGCLLDYVKTHKSEIGPKNLLEWSKQIAKGMEYLEKHRMVHRDLALRNVLLQSFNRALVSDFGLAKLLDIGQSEYHSGGGALPIKWLAPECFREKTFTHKSDVWAFGVTIWELLTYGERPFGEYEPIDVPSAIEKGLRLPQPKHVSVEVYTSIYACWFYNPDERPNFSSLVESFVNFAKDPGRFLLSEQERNSQSEEGEYSSDLERSTGEESPAPASVMSELTPSTTNRSNEVFGFENRNPHHHGSSQLQEQVNENATDLNNNAQRAPTDSCWTMHTMSTQSMCHKSTGSKQQLPTDMYDYLLPSPCMLDRNQGHFFGHFPVGPQSGVKSTPITPLASAPATNTRDPPHSAGITNEEYFMTRVSYVNHVDGLDSFRGGQMGYHSSEMLRQRDQHDCKQKQQSGQHQVMKLISTSNGNVPQSLV